MIVSTALFLATVAFLAAAALMMREALAQRLGHNASTSGSKRRAQQAVPLEQHTAHGPTHCYNDCVRVHEHTDPNFPCSIACNLNEGSHR